MSDTPTDDKQYQTLETCCDEQGRQTVTAMLTPSTDTQRCEMIARTKIIPVLFVPGIMGSNLNYVDCKGNTQTAWSPPNGKIAGVGQSLSYWWFKNAAERAEMLDPDSTSLKRDGAVYPVPGAKNGKQLALDRGWGSVHRDSYGKFLQQLQQWLSAPQYDQTASPWAGLLQATGQSGDTPPPLPPGATPLSSEELCQAMDFRYDVYACGYNWTQDNRASALKYSNAPDAGVNALHDQVERILEQTRQQDPSCQQVILVTHSMGGLVARAYAKAHPERLLGIVHGVMPATGAPATYKRVRAGFGNEMKSLLDLATGFASKILGPDAELAAPPVLNSEGALQLLPWPNYGEGVAPDPAQPWQPPFSHWVRVRRRGSQLPLLALTRDDILFGSAWYSLLPAEQHDYQGEDSGVQRNRRITPSDKRAMEIRRARGIKEKPEDDRVALVKRLHAVTNFQEDHANVYLNGKSYAFYGDDPKQPSWAAHVWEGDIPAHVTAAALQAATLREDPGNGVLQLLLPDGYSLTLSVADPEQSGDGTVPFPSGQAPALAGIPCFKQRGYDHQGAYKPEQLAGIQVALYGIVKFAQQRQE